MTSALDSPSLQIRLVCNDSRKLKKEQPKQFYKDLEKQSPDASSDSSKMAVKVLLVILRVIALLVCLYFFICSLGIMSSSFRLLGGRQIRNLLANNIIFDNPIACLMVGVLLTVLVQSSSTSTSLIVGMVGAEIIELRASVFMIMGANIGTTVTNTIVSMGQIGDKQEMERAFAGATVHDMFNWLTVLLLLPIEAASGALTKLTSLMVDQWEQDTVNSTAIVKVSMPNFIKDITTPFNKLLIQLDSKTLKNAELLRNSSSLIKTCCKKASDDTCIEKCRFLFASVAGSWADAVIGGILLVISLILMICCLIGMVRILRSLLEGKVRSTIERVTRTENRCIQYAMDYVALIVGIGLTILVQSSSVLTSTLTPLVGTGVITVEIMYPMTLGSNIGTTTTGLLAALASAKVNSMQTALTHLLFNTIGVLIWLPIPFLKFVPIAMAKCLGEAAAAYRWLPPVYIVVVFFLLPLLFFGLSLLHPFAAYITFGAIVIALLLIGVINLLQSRRAGCLPRILRTWDFLPEPMRSLAPFDRLLSRLFLCCCCCRKRNQMDIPVETELVAKM